MDIKNKFKTLFSSRIFLIISSFIFSIVFFYSYTDYLFTEWEYYGFTYYSGSLYSYIILSLLILSTSFYIPVNFDTPASAILIILYIIVYIPTIIISAYIINDGIYYYLNSLICLTIVFITASIKTSDFKYNTNEKTRVPDNLISIFLFIWIFISLSLLLFFESIIDFVSLLDVYEQRSNSATQNIFIGYAQTYYFNVINPFLLTVGLIKNKKILIIISILGFALAYGISALRGVFFMPFIMYFLYLALKSKNSIYITTSFILNILSILIFISVYFYKDSSSANILAVYLVFRTFGIPGVSFSQYYNLFSQGAYTYWSHVKGISYVIPAPKAFSDDPSWPDLGVLVGKYLYGSDANNANANLFTGDGVAAAGSLGVLVIGALLTIWLFYLNKLSRSFGKIFSVMISLPLGLVLSNGNFFTTLLSFGGLLWLYIFYKYNENINVM